MEAKLQIGWAQTSITPDRPVFLSGQMYYRISRYVHDPITATALALDNGTEQFVFVSMDMVGVPLEAVERVRKHFTSKKGPNGKNISFGVTHTHTSCGFDIDGFRLHNHALLGDDILPPFEVPADVLDGEEASKYLEDHLIDLIETAWANRAPGGISHAVDYAAIAFNRRPVFDLGGGKTESVMYGACSKDNFVRMEGTSDHTADFLFTWDEQNEITGIVCDIPCPSQVMELHCFISADYWTPTRNALREALGNVYVLPFCGAGGDQNPLDLVRLSKTNVETLRDWNAQAGEVFRNFDMALECQDIGERICEAAMRAYRKARNSIVQNPIFKTSRLSMSLPIRQVSKADYDEAVTELAAFKAQFSKEHPMTFTDIVTAFEPMGVILRYEQQVESGTYDFDVYVVRLGRMVIATNPFELFADYGMRIKARCKADQAFLVQLANDVGGYLPTQAAIDGGSYSSKPASTTVGPEGGDCLVEETIRAINALWEE